MFSMKGQVVVDKRGNKKVGMIVAVLITDGYRVIGRLARFGQQFGFQLLFKEVIRSTLIDQNRQFGFCLF